MHQPYSNLAQAALPHDTLWAIEPNAGRALWQALQAVSYAQHVIEFAAQQEVQAAAAAADKAASKPFYMEGSTAIFSLSGPMTKAPTSWSSGTSTVRFRRQVRLARQDPDVKNAIIVMDSPGGSVSGTGEAAAEVAAFAAEKPIVGVIEDCCCSACYWVGSQCTSLVANPTALVGSIGTVMAMADMSRYAANSGIEILVFGTGEFKGAGTQGAPVTEAHRAYFQNMVETLNTHFLQAVQRGRRMSDEQIAAIRDARVHIGADAIGMGLIDGIDTLDNVLAGLKMPAGNTMQRPLTDGSRKEKAQIWTW